MPENHATRTSAGRRTPSLCLECRRLSLKTKQNAAAAAAGGKSQVRHKRVFSHSSLVDAVAQMGFYSTFNFFTVINSPLLLTQCEFLTSISLLPNRKHGCSLCLELVGLSSSRCWVDSSLLQLKKHFFGLLVSKNSMISAMIPPLWASSWETSASVK